MPAAPFQEYLDSLHQRFAGEMSGRLADYIPELTRADPRWFGITVATADGQIYEAGDAGVAFTIQSISKPFVYGLALEDNGRSDVLGRIGVEPSGDAFNSISLQAGSGKPLNPMINAGAIATTGLIQGRDHSSRFQRILDLFQRYSGRALQVDESVYRSESETGHRNRAIGYMLRNFGILQEDPNPVLEMYFRQCSIQVTCRDLALMGATLANAGVQPVTGEQVLRGEYVESVLSVMASCGMYDYAGEWIYSVGLPAKSGVGGGIVAVLPGHLGIGVFSPPLDEKGNSVRGIKVCQALSLDLNLHFLNVLRARKQVLRLHYTGADVRSRCRRPAAHREILARAGTRVHVFELQGELSFPSAEHVVRKLIEASPDFDRAVLDLQRVPSIDASACRLLLQLLLQLSGNGKTLLFSHASRKGMFRRYCMKRLGPERTALWRDFPDLHDALETCEDALLETAGHPPEAEFPLERFEFLQGLDPDEIERLRHILEVCEGPDGERILCEGDAADSIYLLVAGRTAARVSLPDGTLKTVARFTPGVVFGEMAAFDRSRRSASVYAEGPARCLRLPNEALDALTEREPRVRIRLLENLLSSFSTERRDANRALAVLQR